MLSIPRDLYVYIPDFWMTRINFADMYGEAHDYEGGGLGLLNQTLLYNLGITADYYVKVNFDGLIGLVDAVGGIEMPVFCRLEDYWPYPDENGEYPRFVLEPGIHHLNGEQALWYSRSRKTTSVFSRERRQQQVLEAIWRRGKQANLFEAAPSLYDQWHHLFDTDLGVGNILALAVTGSQLSPADVNRFNIGAGQVKSYVTPYGGYVFLPQWEEIEPVLQGVLARPSSSRATRAPVPIDVWNGTGHADWDRLAAERLLHAGFLPNLDCGDGAVRPQTQLYFYGETTKGSGLASVQRIFHIPDTQVIMQKDPTQAVKLRLVLGQEYNPCR
jgi:LCP family protein required for cell wall assembly